MSQSTPNRNPSGIDDTLNSGIEENSLKSPHFLNIDPAGNVNFISESLNEVFLKNQNINLKPGDSCFIIFPSQILSKFVRELEGVASSCVPGSFSYSCNGHSYKFLLTPVFSISGVIEQIQMLLHPQKRNVLETITDGFFSLNKLGEITYWNKTAGDLLQIPGNKILNRKFQDLFSVSREPLLFQKYREAQNSNKKISFEHYISASSRWVNINICPEKDGHTFYFKDINERKKIEEQMILAQERYRLVAKAIREAVYDWDISNHSLEWSDSYYEIYGYEKLFEKEALSQWEKQIHFEDRQGVISKLNEAIKGTESEWTCEYRLMRADGKIAVILERGYIMRDENGEAIRMIGALQDITTLKQNERALEEFNHQLKKQSAELLQSNAELEQFAYIASHDLQEPLRMVTSFLKLLEKKYVDELDDKAKQYIHFAADGADRMRQIILDLLEYSRIGKLKYDPELVDCNTTIRDIQLLHENMIREKNAIIEYDDLPVIKAASIPLLRVLSNLISNSIKYSRDGIPPKIKLEVRDMGTHWEFIVQDNGIGINDQFKEKIFIIFQRLHSRDVYSGTGIGLATCKKIVENHGGKIWVDSKPGVGSSFHFTIQKHF